MGRLYIIPDIGDMERICGLADIYGCGFEYNDFYMANVLDDSARQEKLIAGYGKYRDGFSMDTMHGAFLDVTIHSSDPLIREASMLRIRQSMKIAEHMGLRGIVFHTGRLANFRDKNYLLNWQKVNAEFFTELANQYPGHEIYMENMFDEAPDVLANLAEQMKGTDNFGVCLDYAHAAISGCPVEEWMEALAPYIRHIHVNDNDLKHDLHQPVGTGRIDWQKFDGLIRRFRIDASVLLEVYGYEAQKCSLEYMEQNGIYPLR